MLRHLLALDIGFSKTRAVKALEFDGFQFFLTSSEFYNQRDPGDLAS